MTESLTIGITGAAGFIGSSVAARLLEAGHDIVPVDNFDEPKVESIEGRAIRTVDVRNRDAVRSAFESVDAVIHLAAVSGVPDCEARPEVAFDTNVAGTENVAWCCGEAGTPLIFAGSMAALGDPESFPISVDHPRNPVNLYGRTKQMSEDDVHALAAGEFAAVVLMKSNIYGHQEINGEPVDKETVINIFVEQARKGEPLTVHRPGTQARDFIHLSDVARAYEHALDYVMQAEEAARTMTIGSGDCRSVLEVAEVVQRLAQEELGKQPEIKMIENPREFETVTPDFTVDTESARQLIGFETERTIEGAVREMIAA